MSTSERKTRGRQKVSLVPMEKQSNRLVTFSKRRLGLFKKASELCTLCGAEAVVVVFSPGRKPFSFGHPSVDVIINRFMPDGHRWGGQENPDDTLEEDDICLSTTKVELALFNNQVEGARKHAEELLKERKAKGEPWWLAPVDEIRPTDLQGLMGPLIELRDKIFKFGQKKVQETSDETSGLFMGLTNPMDPSSHPFPSSFGEGGGQKGLFGAQSLALETRNHSEHRPMIMIPTPMAGLRHPSLAMGSTGSMPSPMGGFDAPNVPAFGGGGQVDGPYNMETNPMIPTPVTGLRHPSLAMGSTGSMSNPMGGFDAPNVYAFGGGGQVDGPYNMETNPMIPTPMAGLRHPSLAMGSTGSIPNPMGGFDAPNMPAFGGGQQVDGPYNMERNPMIPTPMVGLRHPSLAMGSTGSMPNPMGGFDASNVPAFGGGGQVDGPHNMEMNPMTMPSNFGSFTSLLMADSPIDDSNSAYNPNGFGFGPDFY